MVTQPSIYKVSSVYETGAGGGGGGGELVKIGDSYYATIKNNGTEWITSDLLFDENLTNAGNTPISSSIPAYWYINGDPFTNHFFYNHAAIEYFINNNVFPDGWRVPFIDDYNKLINSYDIKKLRSSYAWSSKDGTNESGFSLIGSGYFSEVSSPYFFNMGALNNEWTQTLDGSRFKGMQFGSNSMSEITEPTTQRGYSLRLCRDT